MFDKTYAKGLAERYGIPETDVTLIGLNHLTTRSDMPYRRVRFKLSMDGTEFFLGIPVSADSPFYMSNQQGQLLLDDEPVGSIRDAEIDTCDTSYFRRNGTVLTLNSNSRGSCSGCAFCGTSIQVKNDAHALDTEEKLASFIERLYGEHETYRSVRPHLEPDFHEGRPDLSHLVQVAVLTGCFGSEGRAVGHLLMADEVLARYGFNGELLYVGCEVASDDALRRVASGVRKPALCLSLECFTRRERLLKEMKSRVTVDRAKGIMDASTELGLPSNFIYVMGLDPFSDMAAGFETLAPHVSRFPIVNVFQPHTEEQKGLRDREATDVEYHLRARKELEAIFSDSGLRPRPWENYRPLWYMKFSDEDITGVRI